MFGLDRLDEGGKILNKVTKKYYICICQREEENRAMDFLTVVWVVHSFPIHFVRKEIRFVGKAGEIFSFEKVSLTDSMIIFRI